MLAAYNNWEIDAAKTGKNNSYENYPEVKRIVNKAIGGKKGKMPFFFSATKNGRKSDKKSSDYAKWTPSTMNRIYAKFDCVGNINMSKAKIPPFNWQMLLSGNETEYNAEAVQIFCDLDNSYVATMIWMSDQTDRKEIEDKYNFIKEIIIDELSKFGPLENTYGSITKFLFAGSGMDKPGHKQMYWRIFGDIACSVLAKNMETYTVCEKCGMKIPSWATYHDCKSKDSTGFFECVDCGCWVQRQNSRQYRCESCQEEYRRFVKRKANYINYIPKYHRQQNPYKYKDEIKEDV